MTLELASNKIKRTLKRVRQSIRLGQSLLFTEMYCWACNTLAFQKQACTRFIQWPW